MSIAETIPWKPGALLYNGFYDVYLDMSAIDFEPRRLQARYMAVILVTDEILEGLCRIEYRQ